VKYVLQLDRVDSGRVRSGRIKAAPMSSSSAVVTAAKTLKVKTIAFKAVKRTPPVDTVKLAVVVVAVCLTNDLTNDCFLNSPLSFHTSICPFLSLEAATAAAVAAAR
ncbi:hypothetical protein WUBG_01481, partial [Wuchereria bancrofti]